MQPVDIAPVLWQEMQDVADRLLDGLPAAPLPGEDLELKLGDLGGVAHEVGREPIAHAGCTRDPASGPLVSLSATA